MIPPGLNNILDGRDDGDEISVLYEVLDAHRKVFEKKGKQWQFLQYLVTARALGLPLDEDSIGARLYRRDYTFKLHNNVRQAKHDCVDTLDEYYSNQGANEQRRLTFNGYALSVKLNDPAGGLNLRKSIAVRFPVNPLGDIPGGRWSELMESIAHLLHTELAEALRHAGDFDVHCISAPHSRIVRDYTVHLFIQELQRAEGQLSYALEQRGLDTVKGEPDRINCEHAIPLAQNLASRIISAIGHGQRASTEFKKSGVISHGVFLLCERGFDNLAARTSSGILQAISLFEGALKKDENCALAYAGLSWCYSLHTWYGFGINGCGCHRRALEFAETAVRLDDRLAEAHVALAYASLLTHHNVVAAETGIRTAINLNPECAQAHHWLGNVLNITGRFAEAKVSLEKAFSLNPASPVLEKCLGDHAFYGGQFLEAARVYQGALVHHPHFWQLRLFLSWTLILTGDFEGARMHISQARDCAAASALVEGSLGTLHAASGERAEAMQIADRMERAFEVDKTIPHALAGIYTMLGESERAIRWLQIAETHPVEHLLWVGVDPRFTALRDDPRFAIILERLGVRPVVTAGA